MWTSNYHRNGRISLSVKVGLKGRTSKMNHRSRSTEQASTQQRLDRRLDWTYKLNWRGSEGQVEGVMWTNSRAVKELTARRNTNEGDQGSRLEMNTGWRHNAAASLALWDREAAKLKRGHHKQMNLHYRHYFCDCTALIQIFPYVSDKDGKNINKTTTTTKHLYLP